MNKKAGVVNERKLRDRRGEVLFMDLRRWDENVEEIVIDKGKKKKKTVLTPAQIAEIKKVYNGWQSADTTLYTDVPEFCKSVKILTKDKVAPEDISIEDKDFSLAPSKYIEFIDHDLDIDYATEMTRIQADMRELMRQEKESQAAFIEAFKGIGYGID
jgi:type I restriction enzyme M protein